MQSNLFAGKFIYLGLFLTSLSTLALEILLTRIFSVTMYYHFSFMAISIALFGMTFGAIIVYLGKSFFTGEKIKSQLSISASLFAVTIVVSFFLHLHTSNIFLTFIEILIPFIFSGICISLILTKFPNQIGRLYAADLIGAALGCITVIALLFFLDAPTAVIGIAVLAGAAAILFAFDSTERRSKQISLLTFGISLILFMVQFVLVTQNSALFKLTTVKGTIEPPLLTEKWNSYSRIRVYADPERDPFGTWGFSNRMPKNKKVDVLHMDIDADAYTPLINFTGELSEVDFLKNDIVNIGHHLVKNGDIFIIGVGGGRDILSALAFGQDRILGVEINANIVEELTTTYADYTGNLHKYPNVEIVNDEARSYLERSEEKFDLIQVSLIDTWAATAAGAFTMTENSLYTLEAWHTFYNHLNPKGFLSFSRWYLTDRPDEMYRLTTLAATALQEFGIENPQDHMIVARNISLINAASEDTFGVGTLLVSITPFSDEQIQEINRVVNEMGFDLVFSPDYSIDPIFSRIASGKDLDTFINNFPANISPPTDDQPYFFQMIRLRDLPKISQMSIGSLGFNQIAVYILGGLLILVTLLTILCIIIPLLLTTKRKDRNFISTIPLFIFFLGIGVGYMFVEISQLQRLSVFLGNPTYSLSVVLFSLLVSSGLGSYSTQRISETNLQPGIRRFAVLLFLLLAFGILTPLLITRLYSSSTPIRIFSAVLMITPIGFFMGMAFPLGMKLAASWSPETTPWLWGINGAASVFATVLATAIGISLGISTTFYTGLVCYIIALIAFIWGIRRRDLTRLQTNQSI